MSKGGRSTASLFVCAFSGIEIFLSGKECRLLNIDRNKKWDRVAFAPGMVMADIIKGRLETEGIPVKLRYEAAGRIYALTLNGLGEVEVLVPSGCLRRAREIIAQAYGEDDIPWNHPSDDR
jgi:hypothetical protein